ncbi:hypothetical protein GCM10008983_17970 [Lentibacillus halophilus]|uniref:YtxH domain-containing protein n=1 Tax=Lentibacillus halophilus TaxID=295065 RepID=A0ABP3J5B8_9BACI
MGKQKLCLGMIIGTIAGGLLSLLDRDARNYTKEKLADAKYESSYYVKHPSAAVKRTKNKFDRLNTQLSASTNNAINALEQVENTLDQFTDDRGTKRLGQ